MHMLFCVSLCCALSSAETRLSMPDGTVVTNDVPLVQLADGTLRFRMSATDVPRTATCLEVLPAFMTARSGEPGFWVLPDGRYGTFRDAEGRCGFGQEPLHGIQRHNAAEEGGRRLREVLSSPVLLHGRPPRTCGGRLSDAMLQRRGDGDQLLGPSVRMARNGSRSRNQQAVRTRNDKIA